ncbi:MAG: hypothetical protein ACRDHM_04495 [Actinomycetota bacterium]
MQAVAWSLVGLMATALAVMVTAYFRLATRAEEARREFFGEMRGLRTELVGELREVRSDIGGRVDTLTARIDAQTGRIDALGARMDDHVGRHAG